MSVMTLVFYGLAALGLIASFFKSREKTVMALRKAWKSFENILPQFLVVILIIGIMLSVLTPEEISKLLGKESGWIGTLIAAIVGSVTLVPAFVAFPFAAALLNSGAGYTQIAALVSTLMMVGVVTMPLEMQFFLKRATVIRNIAAFIFSVIAALIIGMVLQ